MHPFCFYRVRTQEMHVHSVVSEVMPTKCVRTTHRRAGHLESWVVMASGPEASWSPQDCYVQETNFSLLKVLCLGSSVSANDLSLV